MSDTKTARRLALQDWLATLTTPHLQLDSLRLASADASFRQFYRLDSSDGRSLIAIDAPPATENSANYIKVATLFKQLSLSVPDVLAHDLEQGFLLVSDLGTQTYAQVLNHDSAHKLYLDAIDSLILMQAQSQPEQLPEYDRAFLMRELGIFSEWYIGQHLGLTLTPAQSQTLDKVFEHLSANAIAQPQVFVHRDYHSRNLIPMEKGNPGIVDFQDALYGPITYDLVSLLRDAYVQWDEELVLDWAIRYWEKARRAGLPVAADIDSFYRDFEWMGLQRHLKILGIFARLSVRDGKNQFLADMPVVMEYIRKTTHRYKELVPLLRLLDELENTAPAVGYTF
ncbi:phosphotransferase [Undibacterium sp. CCC2.1]|uniref:aminoglycoside phosphotransferase family protein n=1 Tax=unclassified Undibacterium TaxID=2630295 RepID=UPI002AC9500D|nr:MULTISPECIES: phosphotransferase [unclassified Undibacterium]MEB0139254.1 phosphotransferase [Undibacterium sp. CCC2.1]MEB0172098.1 phosphotransferase [Undibacterium sp. CCC1.1]MEB0175973.1 phosphotransferase [Undibacterium sp. CCC3.4]MEB0215285.1 phosphotransferase [Undibacterium sp. 5I2]WPX45459.1 phosphotransferase [Undibacterium sp. CCC3.4]